MNLEKLNIEMIHDYDEIWRKAQLITCPKDSDATTRAAWKYKNYSGIEELIEEFLIKNPFDHKSVLSIGCGAGKDVERIKKIFPSANAYGIDTSRHALIEAKKHSNASFVRAYAGYLPFKDDIKFDGFIAGHTLDLTPNPDYAEKIIGEMAKYSAERSRFYITFYDDEHLPDGEDPNMELGITTPVGNALSKFGWFSMHEGGDYNLLEKSSYAQGIFWVEERTL